MRAATAFALLAAAGTVLPLIPFLPWLTRHGPDVQHFFADLFANRIGAFFGIDVFVSAAVLIVFVAVQGRRDAVRPLWLPVAATLLVGVSSGLPLFLLLRERALARRAG